MHSEMARYLLGKKLSDALKIGRNFWCYLYVIKLLLQLRLFACIFPLLVNPKTQFGRGLMKGVIYAMRTKLKLRGGEGEGEGHTVTEANKESLSTIVGGRNTEEVGNSSCPFSGFT